MFSTEREGVTLPAMPFASDPPSAADIAALAARVQSHFLRDARPREVFADLLPQMLAATRSGYGFIAELRQAEDGATTLKVFALTGSDRDDAAGASVPGDTDGAAVVRNLHTMFGAAALESGQPVIANDPTDELRAGLPAGRGALEAFLGVPLLHFGALVGMVGLANRPGGYDAALVATFEPLWSAVGSILGSVKLDRDRRRADQALRERDALLARLTEHVPAVIFQYRRRDGGHECMPYATEGLRQLYGLAPEHVRDNAQALHDRIHPEDLPRVRASIAESARVLSPWRLEFRAQTHDGTRWHEGHAMPERESDGGTLWYGYIVDITERKRYQEALVSVEAAQRANAAKTEFLSRMSHELRTPLNAVLGFAQLMQIDETQSMSDVQRARIGHIERAGTHLLAMINDVLDLSRIEAGTMPLSPEPLAAASVLDDALALVASQAHNAGVKLAPPTASRELWLHADRVRLRQVLANLLSNAIKYNRSGGLVHARADRVGNEVAIAITDTGIGLGPDQLAHLWEPFNRLGAERTTVEGTGIGLALSQRMVQMMDGRIDVQSQAGRGSCFTVHLPAAEAPLTADRRTAAAPAAARRGSPRTVLYAEDNPINVELVQQVFRLRPQLRLLVAESGAQALQLARASPPDLLLLDIHLGDMSGLDVRAQLARAGIDPPAVALSADVQPSRMREALDAGFVDYLAKPLDVAALVRCVDRLLGT